MPQSANTRLRFPKITVFKKETFTNGQEYYELSKLSNISANEKNMVEKLQAKLIADRRARKRPRYYILITH